MSVSVKSQGSFRACNTVRSSSRSGAVTGAAFLRNLVINVSTAYSHCLAAAAAWIRFSVRLGSLSAYRPGKAPHDLGQLAMLDDGLGRRPGGSAVAALGAYCHSQYPQHIQQRPSPGAGTTAAVITGAPLRPGSGPLPATVLGFRR